MSENAHGQQNQGIGEASAATFECAQDDACEIGPS